MSSPVVLVPPATPLVSFDAMKNYGRIDGNADDDLLTGFIAAATDMLEQFTNRCFIARTLRATLDAFPVAQSGDWWDGVRQGAIGSLLGSPAPILVPRGNLLSVVAITTYDAAGVAAVFPATSYRAEPSSGSIVLAPGTAWPSGIRSSAGIVVDYVAGYGSNPTDVPASLRTACMMQVQSMYDVRTCGDLCTGSTALAQPYRILPGL